ncbi:MAG: class I SAM-dependent methyltransferase [Bdellovibrionales bacterium]
MKQNLIEKAALSYSLLRSLNFTGQFLTLPAIERMATGQKKPSPENFPNKIRYSLEQIFKLAQNDAKNISHGLYPLEVLKPQSPLQHAQSLFKVWKDGFQIARRRQLQESHDFQANDQENLKDLPEYARRNFHFQSGGYANYESAELYEHQVEILFTGSADMMRRLIIAPLKQATGWTDGEGLEFLELGCGTGRLTKFMKLAFPKAKILATDMSASYLKKSREQLSEFEKIDFLQTPAENLSIGDKKFDLVYSCFLFHEVPLEIRKEIMGASRRVLKPDGFMGLVDSLQWDDNPELNWALDLFPRDFHEPFYKNYIKNPLASLVSDAGFELVSESQAFLSKCLLSQAGKG